MIDGACYAESNGEYSFPIHCLVHVNNCLEEKREKLARVPSGRGVVISSLGTLSIFIRFFFHSICVYTDIK